MTLMIGLMSGTSLDGVDAALIETDGHDRVAPLGFLTHPYDQPFRDALRSVFGGRGDVAGVERRLTLLHAEAVRDLLGATGMRPEQVRAIGFHGQTILHRPEERRTWQIGDGGLLAEETGIEVVCDFRSADVALGGQGAPLAPLYHAARAAALPRPLAVLNLGGVANVTWIGRDGALLAFDTGPANALVDDWMLRHTGRPWDEGGAAAAAGSLSAEALARLLDHPYFDLAPPKSLDRDDFDPAPVSGLSLADGAATLTAFTAAAVAKALPHLPEPPLRWLATGGGRHNPTLLAMLRERLAAPVDPVEAVGWNGDAIEAEAFAYLAARSLDGLPLSVPGTTGVPAPATGGRLHQPSRRAS